jgi:hypothetical protein
MNYYGTCSCQTVSFVLNLPNPIRCYQPRACDCDFCTSRHIAYLSDPHGSLEITSKLLLSIVMQGSQQAEFLSCPSCSSVVAATYLFSEGRKGAFNTSLLSALLDLPTAISASPKLLNVDEKRQRWQQLWFPVRINIG